MMKDITLGQYYPVKSFVHELDPRAKILLTLAYIVAVFLPQTLYGFLPVVAYIALAAYCAHLPAKLLIRGIRPLRFILIFTFLLNLFFSGTDSRILLHWWIFTIRTDGLLLAIRFSLRLVFLVSGTSLLTLTTTPVSLTDGLEQLLSPLRKLGFPAHELAMMMTIALRFIPTLMEEADKIMKAQMARGADFESGNLLARARAMVPLLVPLFVSAFRRAGDLAMAMEARCYHGDAGRTRLHVLRFTRRDAIAAVVTAALVAVCALL